MHIPVWLYDKDGIVIDAGLPDEWKNDVYLCETLDKIQNIYDSLFINDGKEFSFAGFSDKQKMDDYIKMTNKIIEYIYI